MPSRSVLDSSMHFARFLQGGDYRARRISRMHRFVLNVQSSQEAKRLYAQ